MLGLTVLCSVFCLGIEVACWEPRSGYADPASGVSFTYLTNFVQSDPWHSARLDRISNLVHAAID